MAKTKSPTLPKHYLNYNGTGVEAVDMYETELLKASDEHIDYFYGEEEPEGRKRESLRIGVAMRLNQKQMALAEATEVKLAGRVYEMALFSEFGSIEEWMDHHNIKSAGRKSEYRTISEIVIPWCQQFKVIPGGDQAVEKWFLRVKEDTNGHYRSIARRAAHFTPVFKKIIRSDMTAAKQIDAVREVLAWIDDLSITNQALANAAHGYYKDKMLGRVRELDDNKVLVTMEIDRDQLEYLQEKKLRNIVEWEYEDSHGKNQD